MLTNNDILNIKFKKNENIEYTINDDGIVTILEKQDAKIQEFFRKLKFKIPRYKEIEMDRYCSTVFILVDGKKTIKEIGYNLESIYGNDIEPLFERLLIFLNHINTNCNYIDRLN